MFKNISSYDEIELKQNALLIFDIDETIMRFDGISRNWWINKLNEYYNIHQDHKKANDCALKEWIDHIKLNKAKLIDREKLFNIFSKALSEYNCEIIFITARHIDMKDMTEKHFEECDISEYIHKIYYNENKGILLKELLEDKYKNHKDIIFIDDSIKKLENIYSINNDNENHNLSLYLFNY